MGGEGGIICGDIFSAVISCICVCYEGAGGFHALIACCMAVCLYKLHAILRRLFDMHLSIEWSLWAKIRTSTRFPWWFHSI